MVTTESARPVPSDPVEIEPARRRRRHRPGLAAIATLVLVPLVLVQLLPLMLGLDRFVMGSDDMGDAVPRGSVVLARTVPVGDLRPGDVVTFARPGSQPAELTTRRVVSVSDGSVTTRADAAPAVDPWQLTPADGGLTRMVLHVPYLGFPFLGVSQTGGWWLVIGLGGLTALLWVAPAFADRARRAG